MGEAASASAAGTPAPVAATPLIELAAVSRRYEMGGETIYALRDISFSVARGEYVAIVGASGSGKSTMMNILGCLDTPSSGTYRLRGTSWKVWKTKPISKLRRSERALSSSARTSVPRRR